MTRSIYSKNLGAFHETGVTGFTTIYTVPAGGGPAVIKHVSVFCGVGLEAYVFLNDGTTRYVLIHLNNVAGSGPIDQQSPMFLPIGPGWTIEAQVATDTAPGNEADVIVGGYQFDAP